MLYLAGLLEGQQQGNGQQLELLPLYLPLLREPSRELIARELLQVRGRVRGELGGRRIRERPVGLSMFVSNAVDLGREDLIQTCSPNPTLHRC